ncbi:MAG: MFS transporter [Xanthobacteraceae bacterium]|nr:MFS transporter [Xanthobacteraceae bacterium]
MTEKDAPGFGALFLLWIAGSGLRLTILAVPPVLALIILDLKLSGTEVGILNAIPVSLFALASVPGSLLIARIGAVPALVAGLTVAALGSALRGLAADPFGLYATTALMAIGIAVMQPAMPPTVRQWIPHRIGFATAVYTNGLLIGEIVPVALTAPLLLFLGGSWRTNLVAWSILPVLIAITIFLFQPGGSGASTSRHRRWMPDWRDPLLWKVGLIMCGANAMYFCTNAFIPGLLLQTGRTDEIPQVLTALNGGQIPASFLLLVMASRWERRRWPLFSSILLGIMGVCGIVFSTSPWIVATGGAAIGAACAMILTLVLTLPALFVAPDDVPRMSAGVFTIGYSIAMVVSVLGGIAWDITGNAAFAFMPVLLCGFVSLAFTQLTDFSTRRLETAC